MSIKQQILEDIKDDLYLEAKRLRADENVSDQDKLVGAEIFLNVSRFLNNYDENVKVLQQHELSKKFRGER